MGQCAAARERVTPMTGSRAAVLLILVLGAPLRAELPSILFDHPGLKAEFVKTSGFRLTMAADVPAGTYDVRLVGRFGVSNPRLFAVSHGLTDVAEKEPNDDAATAQKVPINSAVNGTSDGNRDDVYRFSAKK